MRVSSNQERDRLMTQRLCDRIYATLESSFTPARLLISWADQPSVSPGFQIHSTGACVVVQYVQSRDGTRSLRRAHARAMIEQYHMALVAAGWQVEIIDEPRKMPYLRCHPAKTIISN